MKDYRLDNVLPQSVNQLLFDDLADRVEITVINGGVQDNYFCDNFNTPLKVGGRAVKARKYLMVLEQFQNTWSSSLDLILTDNAKYYYQTKANYLGGILKENEENQILDDDQEQEFKDQLESAKDFLEKVA